MAGISQIIFLDGGYSEYCANAAYQLDNPEETRVTGSRLGLSPLEVCNRAIAEEIENRAASFNNRGVIYFSKGDFEAARKDFEQAIRINNKIPDFHFNLGLALVRQRGWSESLEALNTGLGLIDELTAEGTGFNLAEIYYNRGIAFEETGKVRQAYYDYKKASELNPDWDPPQQELSRFTVR